MCRWGMAGREEEPQSDRTGGMEGGALRSNTRTWSRCRGWRKDRFAVYDYILLCVLCLYRPGGQSSSTSWRISQFILPRKDVGEIGAHQPIICICCGSALQSAGRSDVLQASTPTHAAGDVVGVHVAGLVTAPTTHPAEGEIPTETDCGERLYQSQ